MDTIIKKHLPEILYPAINEKSFVKSKDFTQDISDLLGRDIKETTTILTSLNRYERKKNIGLALRSFAYYFNEMSKDEKRL